MVADIPDLAVRRAGLRRLLRLAGGMMMRSLPNAVPGDALIAGRGAHYAPGQQCRVPGFPGTPRQRLGESPAAAALPPALPPPLHPAQPHPPGTAPDVLRPGRRLVMNPGRHRPAVRARSRARATGDRPYRNRAVRAGLRVGYPQAIRAGQHGRRILEHDARGSLMILKSLVRPKIVKAASIIIPAARPPWPQDRPPGPGSLPALRPRSVTTAHHAK